MPSIDDEINRLLDSQPIYQKNPQQGSQQAPLQGGQQPAQPDITYETQPMGWREYQTQEEARKKRSVQERLPGVDIESGGPLGLRMGASFRHGKDVDAYLKQELGADNVERTKDGIVVNIDDGQGNKKPVLFDEYGMSINDLADMTGQAPEIVGAGLAGAALASTGVVSIPVIAAITAITGQGIGAASDLYFSMNQDERSTLEGVARARGTQAVVDFLLGGAMGKAADLITRKAPDIAKDVYPVEQAAARLEQRYGERVPLSLGQRTQNPSLLRTESVGQKLPLSAETWRGQARALDQSIKNLQGKMGIKDVEQANSQIAQEARQMATRQQWENDAFRAQANQKLDAEVTAIGNSLGPGGEKVTIEYAGDMLRDKANIKLATFKAQNRANYGALDQYPEASQPIVSAKSLNDYADNRLANTAREVVEVTESGEKITKPALNLLPKGLQKYVTTLGRLDDMTLAEARELRTVINDAITDETALPGIGVRDLKEISHRLTTSIENAVDNVKDPGLKTDLQLANAYYKQNYRQYLEKDIAPLFLTPEKSGFKDNAAYLDHVFADPGRISRVRDFVGPEVWDVIKRSKWNNMISRSKNIGGNPNENFINSNQLISEYNKLGEEGQKALFGNQYEEVGKAIRYMGARNRVIPLEHISDLRGNIPDMLREAARREDEYSRQWMNTVMKPYIRGDSDQMNPEGFVRHLMKDGNASQIDNVYSKLPNDQKDVYRRAVIQDLFNKSTRSATSDDVINGVVNEGDPIISGRSLFKQINSGYGDASLNKLKQVLGPEIIQDIKDLATVAAAREAKNEASAAGGLFAGGIISKLAHGDFTSLPMLAQYKILSWALTDADSGWLLNMIKTPINVGKRVIAKTSYKSVISQKAKVANVVAPQLIDELSRSLSQEDLGPVLDWLGVERESTGSNLDDNINQFLDSQTMNSENFADVSMQYKSMATDAADRYGLPNKLLMNIFNRESGWDANAVGGKGEQGLGQLMPDTQKDLGIEDPFDPIQAVEGTAKYIDQLVKRFGSLEYGVAAYNWGPGNVRKWLNKGNTKVSQMPQQVQNYVNAVMADVQ